LDITILTEARKSNGTGHLARCCAIYDALSEVGLSAKLIVDTNTFIETYVAGKNVEINDWKITLLADINGSKAVLVDSYRCTIDHYRQLSDSGIICLFIDDFIRLPYPNATLLNTAINALELSTKYPPGCELLLGESYSPLRKEFQKCNKRMTQSNVQSVLISLGGDDINRLTLPIMNKLAESFPSIHKKVIIGGSFSNSEEIEKNCPPNTELIRQANALMMKNSMLSCDVAISAAGQTLYELAATGTPTIAILAADNQLGNYQGFSSKGLTLNAGDWKDNNLTTHIERHLVTLQAFELREQISIKQQQQIDGEGALRIARYLKSKIEHKQ